MGKNLRPSHESVANTYDKIALGFSQTRNHSWPEFRLFDFYLRDNIALLDLGCGNGRLLEYLGRKNLRNVRYIGLDISKMLLEEARSLHPGYKFLQADMMELPLPEVPPFSQDVVCAVASFHHIATRRARIAALKNINMVMKDDGVLILTVWNLWQPRYRKHIAKAMLRSLLRFGTSDPFDTFVPWGKEKIPRYYHAFLPYEMRSLLKKAGFELVKFHLQKSHLEAKLHDAHNQVYICRKSKS